MTNLSDTNHRSDMDAEVVISYSSGDREKVLALVQRLLALNVSVWIDYGNIDGALLWGQEIVEAIEGCKVLILMASESSLASPNVGKEVTLASENRKYILPLHLERLEIPKPLKYPLAGIQHIKLYLGDADSNFLAIVRSLERLGVRIGNPAQDSHEPPPPAVKPSETIERSTRISATQHLPKTAGRWWTKRTVAISLIACAALLGGLALTVFISNLAGIATQPEKLIEIIKQHQETNVRESFGAGANQCFSEADWKAFNGGNKPAKIIEALKSDKAFLAVVSSIRALTPDERDNLLRKALETFQPTWLELELDPNTSTAAELRRGQTELGQQAQKMIARDIVAVVRSFL